MTRSITGPCIECAVAVDLRQQTRSRRDLFRRTGRAYCSTACRDVWVRRSSSERMARTNRVHASARMKARNPMRVDEYRERMAATLNRIGHRPQQRGGNGKPMTEPQRLLLAALGEGWEAEAVVPTGGRIAKLRPPHYKIDLASRSRMVAVEVDGPSHYARSRRAADARKDAFLRERGWRVIRFTNREVLVDVEGCALRCLA